MFPSWFKRIGEVSASSKQLTTGHNLEIMFADRSADSAMILDPDATQRGGSGDKQELEQLAHFITLARKGGYYAIPSLDQDDKSATAWLCFQLLGFRPGKKKIHPKIDPVEH